MSIRSKTSASFATAASVSSNYLEEDRNLTDAFSISGLFPSSGKTRIDSYLIRQHLLQETRRELREFMNNVPTIRRLFTRHCSANTPAASVHTKLKKRELPPTAYENVEPRKSESDETIDCAESVTSLAALNTNERFTIDQSLVLQRCKLLKVDKEELKKDLREKVKMYKAPPTTYGINKMNEIVENLYSLEMELPFMKYLMARSRAQRLARSQASSVKEVDLKDLKKPKTKKLSYSFMKKQQFFPRVKKEQKEEEERNIPSPEPYIMGFFLGKKRTYPAVVVRNIPKISVINIRS